MIYIAWQVNMDAMQDRDTGLMLGLCPANERRRYKVTTFLIGWRKLRISPEAQTYAAMLGQSTEHWSLAEYTS